MIAAVIWHDLECGAYQADLPLWRELADAHGDGQPILEIGAGTGRVTLDLARRGHALIAIEHDQELAAELRRRSRGLPVEVIQADACDFALGARVSLCIVAMQTVQLLADRPAFLHCARGAMTPRGVLALALLDRDVQPFEVELERRRTTVGGSTDSVSLDVTALARVVPTTLAIEGAAAGFAYRSLLGVPPTSEHVGSQVVLLEALP
jgi:SAM-dependent methyltransferase